MNKLLKIDSIMYFVHDLDKSEMFYSEVLGLKMVWRDDNYKMIGFVFEGSDSEIVIHNDHEIPNPDFSFLVENVDEYCKAFKEKGYKVLFGPIDVRPGRYAVFSDLDGNKIPIIDLTKFGGLPKYDKR
jgi:catechol 2,3-dioxygenase-like lactoylglutathione lyase family enzyme